MRQLYAFDVKSILFSLQTNFEIAPGHATTKCCAHCSIVFYRIAKFSIFNVILFLNFQVANVVGFKSYAMVDFHS